MQPEVPLTAWEQAAIVVLFTLVALAVTGIALGAMRWLLGWAGKREAQWQEFISELRRMDVRARVEHQDRTEKEMNEVRKALTEMATAITELTGEFHSHVIDEDARFEVIMTDAQRARVKKKAAESKRIDGSG